LSMNGLDGSMGIWTTSCSQNFDFFL
jgi:hypothetical protein